MKKIALFSLSMLFVSLTAHAAIKPEDLLKWISGHLQTVAYTVTTPNATYPEYESAKMVFDGCNVRIMKDLKTQKSDIQTTISFNLSDVEAGMIRFSPETGAENTQVTPYFLFRLPLSHSAMNTTTFTAPERSASETVASTSVYIMFQDREMADQQASAWRNAALACGAAD